MKEVDDDADKDAALALAFLQALWSDTFTRNSGKVLWIPAVSLPVLQTL